MYKYNFRFHPVGGYGVKKNTLLIEKKHCKTTRGRREDVNIGL